MNHARHDFFAHSAFAANEDGHVHGSDLQNLLAYANHLRARRQERKIFGQMIAIFAQGLVFFAQIHFLPAFQQGGIQLRFLKWLGQVVLSAKADGLDYRGDLIRTRQHDDAEAAIDLDQPPQSLQPVHFLHEHIENDEIGAVSLLNRFEGFGTGSHRGHVVAVNFEQRLQVFADARFVIHHENAFFITHSTILLSGRGAAR